MIIADDFVFLHPPKTGGSFVTEVLMDVYASQHGRSITNLDKHGGVESIPREHRSKPRVTTVRNPFDYYASTYQFGYWIDREMEPWLTLWDDQEMRSRFPGYPYLTFSEFLEGALEVGHKHLAPSHQELARSLRLGPQTVRTLQFSLPDYIAALETFRVTGDLGELNSQVKLTRFLHTEMLNKDAFDWLVDLGIPACSAAQVLAKPNTKPMNTPDGVVLKNGHGQHRTAHWSEVFNERLKIAVEEREWLFFALFPEYQSRRPREWNRVPLHPSEPDELSASTETDSITSL
jgi:hypothetical protein